MRSAHRTLLVVGLIVAATTMVDAHADPVLDYTLGVEIEHDSDVNLSRTDPVSQSVLTPEMTFTVKEDGATIKADVAGTLAYKDYLQNAFADEFNALMAGSLIWAISPERFDWVFDDYLGRAPVSVFVPYEPDNQQVTNLFSTGPTFRAHFSDALLGRVDLRYVNTYAEQTSDFNGDRESALGQLSYLLGPGSNVSGSVSATRARYDDAASLDSDYDRYDAYGGYSTSTRQLKFDAAAGYSVIHLIQQDDHAGPLLTAALTWTPSATTSLNVNVSREFNDAGDNLIVDPSQIGNLGVGSGRDDQVVSPQVYLEKQISGSFTHTQGRLNFNLSSFWQDLDYIGEDTQDQRAYGYIVSVGWLMRPALTLSASAGREHRDYTNIDRTDIDTAYWLGLLWQQSRHWAWQLRAGNSARDSTIYADGYSNRIYSLSLTYTR